MRLEGCAKESELGQALATGQWPQTVSAELRAHVQACRGCREQVLLATSFQQARSQSMAAARIGTPGLVWWRAQLRRRNQAVERVTRPLLGAQIFALVVLLLAGAGFLGYQFSPQTESWAQWKALPAAFAAQMAAGWLLPLVLLTALALFGGLVIFFSSDRR